MVQISSPSEEHRERGRVGPARLAAAVVAERAADRRAIHVDDLEVQPVIARVPGVEVRADQVLGAVTESGVLVAEDLRGRTIQLERLRYREERALQIEAAVENRRDRQRAVRDEVVQPARVDLRLDEDA